MHGIARSDWLAATASLLFLAASTPVPAAQPQSIIDTWRDVTIPPAPELQDIAVDVRHSALIVADMYRTSCIESQRPHTASGAALRGMQAIIPVDAISSVHPFAELYTVWHLKNTAGSVSRNVVSTTMDRISLR